MVIVEDIFGHGDLADELSRRIASARESVLNAPAERVLNAEGELVDELVDHYRLQPASADWERLYADGVEETRSGQLVRIHVPVTGGDREVWAMRPSERYMSRIGMSLMEGDQLSFVVVGRALSAKLVDEDVARKRTMVDKMIEVSTRDVENSAQQLRSIVAQQLSQRRASLQSNLALQSSLNIPLRPAPPAQRIEVPLVRKQVRVIEPDPSARGGTSADPYLSDAIYEDVVKTIRALGHSFERLPRTARRFKEEELRDVILFILNSNYEGVATAETFNGEGKTDIVLTWKDRAAFIGECKIWSGPKNFGAAIDQLFGYTTWRDTKAALILFIRNDDGTRHIAAADEVIRDHPSFVGAEASADTSERCDYMMRHPTDAARIIQLAVIPVIVRAEDD